MATVRHLPLVSPGIPGSVEPHPVDDGGDGDLRSAAEDGLLLVGDIARASGKTVRAIHHYEEVGLLRPHARSKGRYRLYDQAALNRVRWIGKLHDLGLSLAQIQQIVATWERAPSAPGAMAKVRAVYLQKLQETRTQIAHLATLERELAASIDYLDTCGEACDPGEIVAACTDCHVRGHDQTEPELVSGIHCGTTKAARAAVDRGAALGGAED